jgi:glucose/arabinose dehydrogenase
MKHYQHIISSLRFVTLALIAALISCRPDGNTNAVADSAVSPTATLLPTPTPALTPVTAVSTINLAPIIQTGLTNPVYLTHAYDERLFIVEQQGTIRIIKQGKLLDAPFLDIQSRVNDYINEQGLFSIAFHPQYQEDGQPGYGRFFVNYTSIENQTVIASYQVSSDNPDRADPNSAVTLLTVDQPDSVHNGGQLQFGPDGFLYIGMGDGGLLYDKDGNGQNPATLLGATLRLDISFANDTVTYTIPATNPFANGNGARREIWSIGWRNPWRFSFDRLTGDLYVADVGEFDWEEINYQPAYSAGGENYGWNIMEGNHCFQAEVCDTTGLVPPIHEYDHSQGCAIVGGYVYRGRQFPTLSGHYFFSDFCTGTIQVLVPQANGQWQATIVKETGNRVSSFGEDMNGELYVIMHSGKISQITP